MSRNFWFLTCSGSSLVAGIDRVWICGAVTKSLNEERERPLLKLKSELTPENFVALPFVHGLLRGWSTMSLKFELRFGEKTLRRNASRSSKLWISARNCNFGTYWEKVFRSGIWQSDLFWKLIVLVAKIRFEKRIDISEMTILEEELVPSITNF